MVEHGEFLGMVNKYYEMVDKLHVIDRDGTPDDVVYKFMDDEMYPLATAIEAACEKNPWPGAKAEFLKLCDLAGPDFYRDQWYPKLELVWDAMPLEDRFDVAKTSAMNKVHNLSGLKYMTEAKDFYMLWADNVWDGPMSGYVRLPDGSMAMFDCAQADHHGHDSLVMHARALVVYEITWWHELRVRFWHSLFRLFVGSHHDYVYEGCQRVRAVAVDEQSNGLKPYWMHPIYYKASSMAHVFMKKFGAKRGRGKMVGWFLQKV